MGYPVHLFVDAIDDNLLCAVCSGILEDAVLTPCGHSFCALCIHTWLRRSELERHPSELHELDRTGSQVAESQVSGSQGPRSQRPGSQVPGSQGPGSQVYGSQVSGSQGPRSEISGSQVYGSQVSGSQGPGYQRPGSQRPGSQGPRSQGPRSQRPGSLVPGSEAFFWESFELEQDEIQAPQERGSTCPECRTWIVPSQIHPIRSLRSFILAMCVSCDYANEGCTLTVPLERHKDHVAGCEFAAVECAGCSVRVQRDKLADHQMTCHFILSLCSNNPTTTPSSHHPAAAARARTPHHHHRHHDDDDDNNNSAAYRINHLSHRIKTLQADLNAMQQRTEQLSSQLRHARTELEQKQRHLQQIQNVHFDPDYNYGLVNSSVGRLSGLIARFLMEKPGYVDAQRVFRCIRRCYDNFGRCGTAYEDDVWMLLATATVSAWFSPQQKQHLRAWQMSLASYKQCTQWANSKPRPL